jgi:hypothetical protein
MESIRRSISLILRIGKTGMAGFVPQRSDEER